ncbi:hypothetical protein LTR56_017893 [Elasticomyces elasticus]|nr:hypothetical protein LTR56_017893 [Elasticomyces elasticus]KAK4914153.1 hypothetical protein LTR49_017585 [Elasticomyces elasticus]
MKYLKELAQSRNLLVIAAIRQPSKAVVDQIDSFMLLPKGLTVCWGPINEIRKYFETDVAPTPLRTFGPSASSRQPMSNSAARNSRNTGMEDVMEYINIDFCLDPTKTNVQMERLRKTWHRSEVRAHLLFEIKEITTTASVPRSLAKNDMVSATFPTIPRALAYRSFIKSYRDFVAYGVRIAMYFALALLMGTVWLRLPPTDTNIQAFTNAIFFGGAFMSFMAVTYIPAYLEDHALLEKERANGLYGAAPFLIVNFCTSLPYLFLIAVLFSSVVYWLSNFRPSALAFLTWIMWLFLDLVAAESLVVLISSAIPVFVIALATTAFVNGLWMCAGGFLLPKDTLNPFWRYAFHYIDYQAYVFKGMINEFGRRNFECSEDVAAPNGCSCLVNSELADQCLIAGDAVLRQYDIVSIASALGLVLCWVSSFSSVWWAGWYFTAKDHELTDTSLIAEEYMGVGADLQV